MSPAAPTTPAPTASPKRVRRTPTPRVPDVTIPPVADAALDERLTGLEGAVGELRDAIHELVGLTQRANTQRAPGPDVPRHLVERTVVVLDRAIVGASLLIEAQRTATELVESIGDITGRGTVEQGDAWDELVTACGLEAIWDVLGAVRSCVERAEVCNQPFTDDEWRPQAEAEAMRLWKIIAEAEPADPS